VAEHPIIRKRRLVAGVVFLIPGLTGLLNDLFDAEPGTSFALALFTSALVLIGGLVLAEAQRRETTSD
jgi:hypothetical protein